MSLNIPVLSAVQRLLGRITAARAEKLDNLDAQTTSRATPVQVGDQVHGKLNSAVPASPVADSVYERVKALDDAYTAARAAMLDAAVSSRATPAQVADEVNTRLNAAIPADPTANSIYERIKALDDAYTASRAAYLDIINSRLDVTVGSRQASWGATTTHRDRIDGAISSRATPAQVADEVNSKLNAAIPAGPAANSIYERIKALDDAYTAARAGYLDLINSRLDTTVSSRAAASTALSNAVWTNTRAGYLDAPISEAGKGIKGVQGGETCIMGGSSYKDVTVSAVDLDKTFYMVSSVENVMAKMTSTTNLRVTRVGTTGTLYFNWQVVEFE